MLWNRPQTAERSNHEWITDLKSDGNAREKALGDLRAILARGLGYSLRGWNRRSRGDMSALVDDICQEALVRILANLDTFEGRSRFTTWAQKVAVRLALTELRRRRWKDVSLDEIAEKAPGADEMISADGSPSAAAERSDLVAFVNRIMVEELTEKQRTVIAALTTHGMPLEEVARRLGSNRNAVYKLVHDGRVRLKRRLEREGMTPDDILDSVAGR